MSQKIVVSLTPVRWFPPTGQAECTESSENGREYDASSLLRITLAGGLIARKGYKTVLFKGDKRALHDLKLLSQYNYGEDEKGNQAVLPPELSHLWA